MIVIGAGLAGLSAALKLQQAGVDAVVLEAQDRVGGRVHSMRQLGSNKEAGGTYIGAGYTRIIGAAERYGFGDRELSLACASHSGEEGHVALAAERTEP